ncbi:DENN domain-containing protein 1B isoform X2 [Sphaeramia orbicularis]|uniref:DENN domain-containing protein 1B isoform X2 n=1 Tax=Sphaeramia orbicularis TaxID=375764 RepID=UPI00117C4CB4|nr:DENN domain-containing protein 1B-like isoform X2 [Sphaeramia orbicularis]
MGSRLKQNPERTFYWFFEATCPVARDKDPGIQFQFPDDFTDEESCQTLPRFCFPYDIQRVRDGVAVQHFTFVLTDLEGCQRFGFCRLTNSTHTCLCILSYLPWFEVFYKLLNNLADYLLKGQTNEMKALLSSLYRQPIPLAAGSVTLQMVPYFIAPDPRSLPSIPENRNLTELIVAVDVGNLLQLYASMLFERRILIFASKLSTLTSCVHALSAVLYPMYWQHIFIPVLPPHLLDYCCAPMPYLIGVHSSLSERVRSRGLEEVVILNVDTNTLESPFDDLKRIPSHVMSGLKVCLKRQAVSPGCGVSRAFLKAQALLFGGYRDALQDHTGEVCFIEKLFLDHKSTSMRQFLQSAVHLQSFKQFIDSRLDILNKGKEPDDLFEEELLYCETSAGRNKSYQHLVGNIKKGGGALIHNMKSKANLGGKGLTKSGLKNLLVHKVRNEEHTLQRGGSVSHRRAQSDSLQNRLPITHHFGMSRPRRPVHQTRAARDEESMNNAGYTWDGAVSGPLVDPDSELQKDEDEEEDSLLCDPEEMDLLGEIFDTLSSRSCHDRGLLYGTRSLDLFGPDSHDFITKHRPTNPSQESLSLSISGSGSLHSWNLETTEELSDMAEDSDWQRQDPWIAEEEEGGSHSAQPECENMKQEKGQRDMSEEQEDVKVAINGDKEEETADANTSTEIKLDEGKKKESQETSVSFEKDTETVEEQDKKELKEKKEVEQNQEETAEIQVIERRTNQMQKDVAREEERKENKEEEEADALNKLIKLTDQDERQPTVVEAVTSSPQSHILCPEKTVEEAGKKEAEMTATISSPPRVQSAIARYQHQASSQGLQVKSRIKAFAEPGSPFTASGSRENTPTHPTCDSNTGSPSEEPEREDLPPIKVSELKKRFEA